MITKGYTFIDGETVTPEKLNDLVDDATIDAGGVDTTELAAEAVTTAKIEDAAVTAAKLATLTATGTSSARAIQDHLADVVNVKNFGAVGDGTTDDTTAIQAAITANPGKVIFLPSGTYKITSTLTISANYTALVGAQVGATRINVHFDTTEPAIKVQSGSWPATPEVFGAVVENIYLHKLVANSVASEGIEFVACNALRFQNCVVSGFANGVLVKGGKNNFFSDLRISLYNPVASIWPAGSSALTVTKVDGTGSAWAGSTAYTAGDFVVYDSATYICITSHTSGVSFDATKWYALTGYTHMFDSCIISGDFAADFAVRVLSNDYTTFSHCYLASANTAIMQISTPSGNDYVYDVWCDHCYFDGAAGYASDPSPLGVWVTDTVGPNSIHNFTDCSFGQMDAAMLLDGENANQVGVVACRFRFCYEKGILLASDGIDFRMTGCVWDKSCSEITGASMLQVDDAQALAISGNIFNFDLSSYLSNTRALRISSGASIKTVAISGNCFISASANVTDYSNAGGTITKLTIAGNSSNNSTNTVVGLQLGNTANAEVTALDWYEEGTWTPALAFGGSSTGITYTTQLGRYTRIGDRVYFDCYILLSSKGAQTGAATISGIPFNQATDLFAVYTVGYASMNAALGASAVYATQNNTSSLALKQQASGGVVDLANTVFTNTSGIGISGCYRVA